MKNELMRFGQRAAPIAALVALCLLFFWKMLFTNLIIARGDLFIYFYPYRDYAASALREGRVPLWNPYLFMGAPLLANSQAGFFYPPNLLSSSLPLGVTRAVSLNIAAHIGIATIGAYVFARKRLGVSILAAWLGGVSFGLGGYLGAQVEHLNQLQALAWMPWLWLAYEWATRERGRWPDSLLAGLLVGLMLLAGHSQSVFITLVGLATYALWPAIEQGRRPRMALRAALLRIAPLAIMVAVGVTLAAIQLLPTAELTRLSPRGGGLPLNEAVSFSLDPRLIGRALLPDYDGALPAGSEFTAFFGMSALMLMIVGLLVSWLHDQPSNHPTNRPTFRALSIVTLLGLFLALGGFNPLYYLLVRIVPGLGLFRAPARWLALFAFGGSMLAAVGLDAMGRGLTRMTRMTRIRFALPLLIVLLIGSTFISADITPAGAAGPVGLPSVTALASWTITLVVVCVLLLPPDSTIRILHSTFYIPPSTFVLICCLELFLATRHLPYNAHLTAPDALTSLRPALTQLMLGEADTPPPRFLSISDIQFDPGDTAELKAIFADQLAPQAFYDLIVATKQKEIAAPNLPLYYRLPAVDGYDGGVLPLRSYLTFQRLFLPPDAIQPDGRLREQLKSIPGARWLDLMNVKYVITDKVRDRWLDDVFYDLQFETQLGQGDEVSTDQVPPLEADALGIVYSEPLADSALGEVELTFVDGSVFVLALTDAPLETVDGLSVARLHWNEAQRVSAVRVRASSGFVLHGVALIDERSGTFQSFVLAKGGRYRLAHSGDVKVHENLEVLPRAFVVPEARFAASDDEALALMQRPDFDPSKTVVIVGEASSVLHPSSLILHPSSLILHPFIRFTRYAPEYISLEVTADSDGYLVLTDAWYPGWTATIDGAPVEILRANVLFRALPIPAGTHQIEFRFDPLTFRIGAGVSAVAWLAAFAATSSTFLWRRNRAETSRKSRLSRPSVTGFSDYGFEDDGLEERGNE